MSKVKLLLDVVEDLRSLADSVQAVANDCRCHVRQNRPHRHKIGQPLRPKHGRQPGYHPQAERKRRRSLL